MTIGERIKAARVQMGLTQKELADKLELATGTIQQYELGKRQPRIEQLQRIAAALDVPVDQLMGTYTKEPAKHVPTDNPNDRYPYLLGKQLNGTLTAEEGAELDALQHLNRIASSFNSLTAEDQKQIVELVRKNAEKHDLVQQRTIAHLEIMDDSKAFLKIYNDYLNDHGKREVHKYTEYLITKEENLKNGIPPLKPKTPSDGD